jgi:hypothetical protein
MENGSPIDEVAPRISTGSNFYGNDIAGAPVPAGKGVR